MRYFTETDSPEDFLGSYGVDYRTGLLAEHADLFVQAGGKTLTTGSGRTWAFVGTGVATPVVCGDIIQINTEDGPESGRCGLPTLRDGACAAHAVQHDDWRAQSEAETVAWERALEGLQDGAAAVGGLTPSTSSVYVGRGF